MKYNYFLIPSLPDIIWDLEQALASEKSMSMLDYFKENEDIFADYKSDIDRILFINELRNIELVLKSKIESPEGFHGNVGDNFDYFFPALSSPEEIERFLEDPISYEPDYYPEEFVDFFMQIKDNSERYSSIDELYVIFLTPEDTDSPFMSHYLSILAVIRIVVQAVRLTNSGMPIDENLKGESDLVSTVMENRSSSDFGLSVQYPFVSDLVASFDSDPITTEFNIDKILYTALTEFSEDDLFGDHVIFTFLIGLFIKERWNDLDNGIGMDYVNKILSQQQEI